MKLHKPIQKFIEKLETESLSEDRKSILQPLVDYINLKAKANQTIKLNFICTHNSRRSHLARFGRKLWRNILTCQTLNVFPEERKTLRFTQWLLKLWKMPVSRFQRKVIAKIPFIA